MADHRKCSHSVSRRKKNGYALNLHRSTETTITYNIFAYLENQENAAASQIEPLPTSLAKIWPKQFQWFELVVIDRER